jgi:HEAT repeat protein
MLRLLRLTSVLLFCLPLASCANSSNEEGPSRDTMRAEAIAALETPDPSAQVGALMKLVEFGREARVATPTVLRLLKSKDKDVRRSAAATLAHIGTPEDAVGPLTESLKDPDATVRNQAAMSLGAFGPAAQSALPQLENIKKEDRCNSVTAAIQNIRR